jgi:hypothetical protein
MTSDEIVKALRCCAKGLGHDDACENCKVGETQDRHGINANEIGKTVFLTREETERAMEGKRNA